MRRRPAYENLYTLLEDHVFSSEELDLIQQRINEELEHDSNDILQTWKHDAKNIRKLTPGRFL